MISPDTIKAIYQDIREKNPEIVLEAFTSKEAREVMWKLVAEDNAAVLDTDEKVDYVMQEMVGLGAIETIIKQHDTVTDITFNGNELIVKRSDLVDPYPYEDQEITEQYILKVIQKFANAVEKEFTPKDPILDASLGNLRINAVHKAASPYGTTMAIRVSRPRLALTKENFSDFAPDYMYEFFKAAVAAKANIGISGETGSGKTEFQKFLISFIPYREKIIWIEDTREGHLKELFGNTKDIHSWLTSSGVTITDLVKAALRNNPKWICPSETRGMEAYEMLQAVLSSHSIISTLHANSVKTMPRRFINMMKMGYQIDEKSTLDDIYENFHLGVHLKVTEINGKWTWYLSEVGEYNADGSVRMIFKQEHIDGKFVQTVGEISQKLKGRMLEHQVKYSGLPIRGE
ncbi:ATPase, T2SS/T4P/T4SS family (plasmid) [Bacillus velezensis]|uniref:ATPase, T2SS/T4P/T4SS family n=1 Tax=Bacillus amyloliquefaciens group TaxID=1938374 RepID=UPI001C0C1AA4|nr:MULTISPECIES: ATPase, T2SS/T4P/T4SS family [Bacillus amyloliquefaciens group]QWQ49736.1 Flp pilus assembly complex ATPase component TadA [Bacillus velezensis]QYC35277.1 CpaF family protein [Bacillus amyloliquefaciens]